MPHRPWILGCIDCARRYPAEEVRYRCECGGTLEVRHDWTTRRALLDLGPSVFDQRRLSREAIDRSGVWRFRELVLPLEGSEVITKPEGNTNLYCSDRLAAYTGSAGLTLKHEGENPTGSFKDRGMTVAISVACALGYRRVACASTGNTSASMAAYAAQAGIEAYVFIPEGKIAYGKLSQSLAYGARTIQIEGDFDLAMKLVEEVCGAESIYLVNSINPYRIEGQKAIGLELLQDLGWRLPDWIVLPGGNLGNSSALVKGLFELREIGWLDRLPRVAVIQAAGASPLYTAFRNRAALQPLAQAETLATAIKIGNPVSWKKSLRGVLATDGVVEQVSDQEILDAKAQVDAAGIGAEPASCATVAGVRKLIASGAIRPDERVCGILTGHLLKDPDLTIGYHKGELAGVASHFANAPVRAEASLSGVRRWLKR